MSLSNVKTYSFNTAFTQVREVYGIELNPDEFESMGLIGWEKIGNRRTRLYRFTKKPIKDTYSNCWYVDLPCNVDFIESVTSSYQDYQKTSSTDLFPEINSGLYEGYIESRKFNPNPLYQSGKYIKYDIVDDKLIFNDPYDVVNVVYKGIIADDAGLPMLNEKELHAIGSYCAYAYSKKKFFQTGDRSTWDQAQIAQQDWLKECSAARVPMYMNQNEMNEILDVVSSWDRKMYGKSYKPIK